MLGGRENQIRFGIAREFAVGLYQKRTFFTLRSSLFDDRKGLFERHRTIDIHEDCP